MSVREILDAVETCLDDCAAVGNNAAVDRLGAALSLLEQAALARAKGITLRLRGDIEAAKVLEYTSEGFISRARRVL